MASSNTDREKNASVFRASSPNPGHYAMQDHCSAAAAAAAVAPNKRRSWWAAYNNEERGRRGGKRRRTRAVPKPPITQLSAQDKAHFKRMVELFTGLGSSSVNSCLSKSALAAPLLSCSPSAHPPCLPPPSHSSLSSPYTQLDLDIISALRTPIATHILPPPYIKEFDNLGLSKSYDHLLLTDSHDHPLPISSLGCGYDLLSHFQIDPKNTSSISSSALTSSLSCSSLTIQLHNNPTNTNPNSSINSSPSDDPSDQIDLKSLFASPTSVDSNSETLKIQMSDHWEDSCHLLCFGGDSSTISDVSCSYIDKQYHEMKFPGVKIQNPSNDANHNWTSNPCSHDVAINNHADKFKTFERVLNALSQKNVIKEEEDMVWGELPWISMDNAHHKQAQQQVEYFEKQVKELENFLLKENDNIDDPFAPICIFLKQHAPDCQLLSHQ